MSHSRAQDHLGSRQQTPEEQFSRWLEESRHRLGEHATRLKARLALHEQELSEHGRGISAAGPLAALCQLRVALPGEDDGGWREGIDIALRLSMINPEVARDIYQAAWWTARLRGDQLHAGGTLRNIHEGLLQNEEVVAELARQHPNHKAVVILHSSAGKDRCIFCDGLSDGFTDIEHSRMPEVVMIHGVCAAHALHERESAEDYQARLSRRLRFAEGIDLDLLCERMLRHGLEKQRRAVPHDPLPTLRA